MHSMFLPPKGTGCAFLKSAVIVARDPHCSQGNASVQFTIQPISAQY